MQNFGRQKPLRTGSLIVSIFGDSIAPRGGEVWLGSLINVLDPLGISERVVRTAVFRLVKDGILANRQIGRKSYYTLTEAGRMDFAQATRRIYTAPRRDWDGQWGIILTSAVPQPQRQQLRKDLQWLGFGSPSADLFIHPNPDQHQLQGHLNHLGCADVVTCFQAHAVAGCDRTSIGQLVERSWDLHSLETGYRRHLSHFQPILEQLPLNRLSHTDAFYLRTFVIHEYRKTLLRDPGLPAELLPEDWAGSAAFDVTRSIYQRTVAGAEAFIDQYMQTHAGTLPPAGPALTSRFGGL